MTDDDSVEAICDKVMEHFSQYDPVPATSFIVAGYNIDDQKQHICRVYIATKEIIPIIDTSIPGTLWDGEADILKRLVKFVGIKNEDGTYTDLPNYSIGFNFFTLQDAINFAEYAVDVTIKTMSFQDCVKTVGGPIDILAIKPSGIFWIQHKELHI